MPRILRLVPPAVSAETVEMLTDATYDAMAGDVVGAAIILLHPGGDFTIDVAGVARLDPLFARGICAKLDDELSKMPQQKR